MLKAFIGLFAVVILSGFGFVQVPKGPAIGRQTATSIETGHTISAVELALGRPGTLISVDGGEFEETRVYLWESETDSLRVTTKFDKVVGKVYLGREVKLASDARPLTFDEQRAASASGFSGRPQGDYEKAQNDYLGSQAAQLKRLER